MLQPRPKGGQARLWASFPARSILMRAFNFITLPLGAEWILFTIRQELACPGADERRIEVSERRALRVMVQPEHRREATLGSEPAIRLAVA